MAPLLGVAFAVGLAAAPRQLPAEPPAPEVGALARLLHRSLGGARLTAVASGVAPVLTASVPTIDSASVFFFEVPGMLVGFAVVHALAIPHGPRARPRAA